ncbi:hypothetical protein GLOIN_2v1684954 [Rhizophagus irregularis DAOM 181602=DAOM 197198]|nr:hypothetical protein GLOIN_2v1684954 [Rhizophagus irregularis DAOM 181602=DAOM 197198]
MKSMNQIYPELDDDDFSILRKEKITGLSFLDLNEENFRSVGFVLEPATLLAKEHNKHTSVALDPHPIEKNSPEFKLCIDDILRKIKKYGEAKNQPVAQNFMQCKSSCDMNLNMLKKKRKSDEAFGSEYEYVYGIVTTDAIKIQPNYARM